MTISPATTAPAGMVGPDVRVRVDAALAEFIEVRLREWATLSGRPEVTRTLRAFVLGGGKRIRPVLCYWGWRGAGGDNGTEIVKAAAALELLHAFALIHDDVMDHSDVRRGTAALHRQFACLHSARRWRGSPDEFGVSVAVLCGDLCAAWADWMLADCGLPVDRTAAARAVLNRMRTELIAGQYLDLHAQSTAGPLPTAMHVIRLKTALYSVVRPLQIGAALAGGEADLAQAYAAFGMPLGEAYQLRDDVLGVFGEPGRTGKSTLDDLRAGKRTALLAITHQRASPGQRARLDRLVGDVSLDEAGAAEVRDIITSSGARDAVEDMISGRARVALDRLATIPIEERSRHALTALTHTLTHRVS